jgi:hypothetical protein
MKQLMNGISGRLLFSLAILACPTAAAWADIVTLSLPFAGVASTYALGVNDSGEIVGVYTDALGATHGFLDKGGVFTSINVNLPGVSSTVADGINNAGVISGVFTTTATGSAGEVFLDTGGTFSYPNTPAVASAEINDNGEIAGLTANVNASYVFSGGTVSFVQWSGPTAGFPGFPVVLGLNKAGQLVGYGSAFPFQGFVGTEGTFAMVNDPNADSSIGTLALGINNSGGIVGEYFTSSGENGFVDIGGVFTTLDYPGSVRTEPRGINDLGEIVGDYTDSSGVVHGFVDSPAPEPSYSVLLVTGAAGLALARRRKRAALMRRALNLTEPGETGLS